MLDVDWADGLVAHSNVIRWVGAPAEITRRSQDRRGCVACRRHEARPTMMM